MFEPDPRVSRPREKILHLGSDEVQLLDLFTRRQLQFNLESQIGKYIFNQTFNV